MLGVDSPIFVIGSGRSGTTLLYNLLCRHPGTAWFTNLTNNCGALNFLSVFSRSSCLAKRKLFAPSSESIMLYEKFGFIPIARNYDSAKDNVDGNKFRSCVRSHMRWMNAGVFVNKNTSNCMRIGALESIFERPRYIFIQRNPYAICNSLLRVPFWRDLNIWWLGKTPREWEGEGRSEVELAALHLKTQTDCALQSLESIDPERVFKISYEDLVESPKRHLPELLRFSGLRMDDDYLEKASRMINPGSVVKWKDELDEEQVKIVYDTCQELFEAHGYAVGVI